MSRVLRRPKFWVVLTLVVAVLLVVADRGGKFVVERIVADRVQEALSTRGTPSVTLGGFPFLTQLVGQKFSSVEVDARDADAGKVTVQHVHAKLTGVERAGDGVRAESIRGEGLITYADASAAAPRGVTLSYGGSGLVKGTAKATVAGQTRTGSATGKPRIEGNELIVELKTVSSDDIGAAAPVAGLVPDVKIALREIPKGLTIKLNPTEDGIEFTFTGRNVSLSSADITALEAPLPVSPGETAGVRRRAAA